MGLQQTPPRCQRHRALAGWRCSHCEQALCPDCAGVKRVHPVELTVCLLCGEVAEPLVRSWREEEGFFPRALRGLAYPLHGVGLAAWLGLTLPMTASLYLGGLGRLVGLAMVLAGLFAVARSAGRGDGHLETAAFTDLLSGLGLPVLRFTLATAPVWLCTWAGDEYGRPALKVLGVVLAFVWAPTAFLGAAAETSLLRLLNPVAVLGTMVRIGVDAQLLALFLVGLTVSAGALSFVGGLVYGLGVPLVSKAVASALLLYAPLTAAHISGLILLLHPEPFGGAAAPRPLLGDLRPRGEVPADAPVVARPRPKHLEPIELPQADAPGKPAEVAPAPAAGLRGETASAARLPGAVSSAPAAGLRGETASAARLPGAVSSAPAPRVELHAHDLPSMAEVALKQLRTAMADGDQPLALDTFRATPEVASTLGCAELNWVGRVAASSGDDEVAERAFRGASAMSGAAPADRGAALVYLGRLLAERRGQPAEARRCFEAAARDCAATPAADFARRWLTQNP